MADTVVYTLSSVDQGVIRTYIRVAFCFPCREQEKKAVAANLTKSVRRVLSWMPVLAGKVHSASDGTAGLNHWRRSNSLAVADKHQRGKVEVRLTLADVQNFQVTLKTPDTIKYPHTWASLAATKMPAIATIDLAKAITPLPDMPSGGADPVFAAQANFIDGGVIVALYLHHSVADIQGLANVVRYMSASEAVLPTRKLTHEMLMKDAMLQTATRKRLRDSQGTPANLAEHPEYNVSAGAPPILAPSPGAAYIITFSMKQLQAARDMVINRFRYMKDIPAADFSTSDVLAAILWKLITRARGLGKMQDTQLSTLIFPVNVRAALHPPLGPDYYGNACMFATTTESAMKLMLPVDVGSLGDLTRDIRIAIYSMTERKIRSGIAIIEESKDVRTLNHPPIDYNRDVFLTSWECLPTGSESTLGLGLGAPEFVRKPSRQNASFGCVMMPQDQTKGEWPVLLQLRGDVMARLLEDPALQSFVCRVA